MNRILLIGIKNLAEDSVHFLTSIGKSAYIKRFRLFIDWEKLSELNRCVPFQLSSNPIRVKGVINLDKNNQYYETLSCTPSLSKIFYSDGYTSLDEWDLTFEIMNRFNRAVRRRNVLQSVKRK